MKLLKEKILNEGRVIGSDILKVDNFINHQIDIKLMNEVGKEFKKRFADEKIDKILTIETSGIGIACIAAQYFNSVPVVFAKKTESLTLGNDTYNSEVFSFTKKISYTVRVNKGFISKGERILIIDDFLANGCAALGLVDILNQAEAEAVGIGIVIEKGFQPGRCELEKRGLRVESLAIIDKIADNKVYFK